MFGRSKWRLLTFITGILLASTIHSLGPQSNPEIGFRVHETPKIPHQTVVRNLLSPQEYFSTVDHVRFMERRLDTTDQETVAEGHQIGSFRLAGKVENFTGSENPKMYTVPNVTKTARSDFNDEFMYDDADDDRSIGVIDTRTIRPELPTSLQKQPPRQQVPQRPNFVPQGYQEDRFDFDEFLMANQKPFQVDEHRREHRIGRTVVFPGEETASQEGRLKSIINVETSLPVGKSLANGNYGPQQGLGVQRQAFSPSVPYFPPKSYEIFSDYPGPPKHPIFPQNQNQNSWRSRSPRVIFPEGPASPYSSDNVVFRWVIRRMWTLLSLIFSGCVVQYFGGNYRRWRWRRLLTR